MKTCPDSGRPIVEISHSGLNAFNSCPRKFAYRKILTVPNEKRFNSTAASVGTALHEGLQHFAIHKNEDAAILEMARHHPAVLKEGDKAEQYSLEAATTSLLKAMEHELFSFDLVYVDTPDHPQRPAVEVKFLVIVDLGPDCPVIFHLRGYIDLIMRNPFNGHFLPIDIKTMTPQARATAEDKYTYDNQLTSYGIPLNALLGNHGKFDTGIFGVILSDNKPDANFYHYTKTQGDIEDYQIYLLDKCSQIARYYRAQHFPRGPQNCVAWGRLCNFHAHCHLRTMKEMQMRVNPSLMEGEATPDRPEEAPWLTMHIHGDEI